MLDPEVLGVARVAVEAAEDKKAFEMTVLDVAQLTSVADLFMICSGASERQVRAISEEIEERLRRAGFKPLAVEGERGSDWVLLDFGELVIHVFTEARRSYYSLERLWSDAPEVSEHVAAADAPALSG